eukprot:2815008-Prymnesium_polylepis.1
MAITVTDCRQIRMATAKSWSSTTRSRSSHAISCTSLNVSDNTERATGDGRASRHRASKRSCCFDAQLDEQSRLRRYGT